MDDVKATVLSAEELLAAPDCVTREIEVPELGPGRTVRIKGFTKQQATDCRERAKADGVVDMAALEREWFLQGLVEPKVTPAQYDALLLKPAGLYFRILNAILAESGLTEEVARDGRKGFLAGP